MGLLFEAAAKRYCEAKEADRVVREGMKPDEECTNYEAHELDERTGHWYDGNPTCRHDTDPDWTPYEDAMGPDPLPREKWCPACQHNEAIIDQSRKIRARFGGLASAMMTAYRNEQQERETT